MGRRTALVAFLCASAAAGCSSESWRELALPADGVRVEMPGPSTQSASKTGGRVYAAEVKGTGYAVDVEDLPDPPAGPDEARLMLDGARDDLAKAVPGTRLTEDRDVSVPGRPGRALRIENANGETALVRMYLVGDRYVKLVAGVRNDPESVARAERFFDSFRTLDPPAPIGLPAIPVIKREEPVAKAPRSAEATTAETAPEAEVRTYAVFSPPSEPAPPAEPETAVKPPAAASAEEPAPASSAGGQRSGGRPTGDRRTVWRYVNAPVLFSDQGTQTGEFRKVASGWVEQAGANTYSFVEVARTADHVEIVRTNGFRVRLFADHSDYRRANDPVWRPMYPGGWVGP